MEVPMKGLLLLLASLNADISPAPSSSVPAGTIMSINATICLNRADLDMIIDTELGGGDTNKVFGQLGNCDSYCISGMLMQETRRFRMRENEQLYAVFEVAGLGNISQSFWAATAINSAGWPISVTASAYDTQCKIQNKEL